MVADFIAKGLSGSDIPDIKDIYPNLTFEQEKKDEELAMAFYKDQMMMFAEKHNAQRRENKWT